MGQVLRAQGVIRRVLCGVGECGWGGGGNVAPQVWPSRAGGGGWLGLWPAGGVLQGWWSVSRVVPSCLRVVPSCPIGQWNISTLHLVYTLVSCSGPASSCTETTATVRSSRLCWYVDLSSSERLGSTPRGNQ